MGHIEMGKKEGKKMEWWRAIVLTVCIIAGCIITSMLADDYLKKNK